jgi:hypothetical protein
MNTQDVFNDGEVNELLRWKDLSFAALIQTLELPISLHKSVVLAGGVYTNWHHREGIKDIDVFILKDGHEAAILSYLKSKIGSIFDPNAFKNASDYKRDNTNIEEVYNAMAILPRVLYQFIFTKYKTREELISHFDFLHCTPNYYNSNLYVRKDAFEAIRDKRLVVHNKDNQVEWRRHKFLTHRGFTEHEHMTYNLGSGGHVPWSRYSKNIAQNA